MVINNLSKPSCATCERSSKVRRTRERSNFIYLLVFHHFGIVVVLLGDIVHGIKNILDCTGYVPIWYHIRQRKGVSMCVVYVHTRALKNDVRNQGNMKTNSKNFSFT